MLHCQVFRVDTVYYSGVPEWGSPIYAFDLETAFRVQRAFKSPFPTTELLDIVGVCSCETTQFSLINLALLGNGKYVKIAPTIDFDRPDWEAQIKTWNDRWTPYLLVEE